MWDISINEIQVHVEKGEEMEENADQFLYVPPEKFIIIKTNDKKTF